MLGVNTIVWVECVDWMTLWMSVSWTVLCMGFWHQ